MLHKAAWQLEQSGILVGPTQLMMLLLLIFLRKCLYGQSSFSLLVQEQMEDRILLIDKGQKALKVEILYLKQI